MIKTQIIFAVFLTMQLSIAADNAIIENLKQYTSHVEKTYSFTQNPIQDAENFIHISSYQHIQPKFRSAVLESPKKAVLDIGSGRGFTIKDILENQEEDNAFNIDYTAVDTSHESMTILEKIVLEKKKLGKKIDLKTERNSMLDFLESKKNKYDLVFAGFSLHVLQPWSYVTTVELLSAAMKKDGLLFLTQHSATIKAETPSDYYPEAYLDQLKKGNIFPFKWSIISSRGERRSLFMSDPVSMENLLETYGFKIETCGLFEDCYINGDNVSKIKYVGIVARKYSSNVDMGRRSAYIKKALEIEGGNWLTLYEMSEDESKSISSSTASPILYRKPTFIEEQYDLLWKKIELGEITLIIPFDLNTVISWAEGSEK